MVFAHRRALRARRRPFRYIDGIYSGSFYARRFGVEETKSWPGDLGQPCRAGRGDCTTSKVRRARSLPRAPRTGTPSAITISTLPTARNVSYVRDVST